MAITLAFNVRWASTLLYRQLEWNFNVEKKIWKQKALHVYMYIYISFSMFHKYLKWSSTCKISSFCKCHVICNSKTKQRSFCISDPFSWLQKSKPARLPIPFNHLILLLCRRGHQPEPKSHLNTSMTVKCVVFSFFSPWINFSFK